MPPRAQKQFVLGLLETWWVVCWLVYGKGLFGSFLGCFHLPLQLLNNVHYSQTVGLVVLDIVFLGLLVRSVHILELILFTSQGIEHGL